MGSLVIALGAEVVNESNEAAWRETRLNQLILCLLS